MKTSDDFPKNRRRFFAAAIGLAGLAAVVTTRSPSFADEGTVDAGASRESLSKDQLAAYDAHVEAGTKLLALDEPAKACQEIEAARKILADTRVLRALGQCYAADQKWVASFRALREAARSTSDPATKTPIEAQLETVMHKIGLVAARAECETKPVTIAVDGERWPASEPLPLTPGVHLLRISCELGEVTKNVSVTGGEQVELEIPVDAWRPPSSSVRQPSGCGCTVIGR